ncbi:MAG: amidophosphoribosyltransferase [Acidobacteriota bacterium]|nr:amidophosphoribosyltransferase [Acidobacteriota bacterium]
MTDRSSDKFKDECGVFGVFGHKEASTLTQLGMFALQHRGQEACGIVSAEGDHFFQIRKLGLVADNFGEETLRRLPGSIAIGHTRYSTAGRKSVREAQPFSVTCQHGKIAVCHNGNLPDAERLRAELESQGAIFNSTSDTETILHSIARADAENAVEAIADVLSRTEGAFSLLFLIEGALIAVRDPRGFRPLVLGKLGDTWAVASETCAFDLIDAEYVREIEAGEMLVIDKDGLHPRFPFEKKPLSVCTFEHVYFSRPDSIIYGRSINQSRHLMGRQLAIEHPVDADIVVPVPDSGVAAAIGYAAEADISFRQGIIRNHYIGRTFIEPSQSIRSFGVRLKLNPIEDLIAGRKVVLVDDSIVRGTTSKKIVALVREAGASEVHMRISCPPTIAPCFYGVNTPRKSELIASQKTVEEVREHIAADSLGYLSLEGMLEATGMERQNVCVACWTDDYPTVISN